MFSSYVFILLHFFNLWGFCTELSELRASRWRHRKLAVLMIVLHIIYLCCMCGLIWCFLYSSGVIDLLDATNDAIKFAGAAITRLIVIFESYAKRNVQRKFWNIFCRIRTKFNRCDHNLLCRSYFAESGPFLGVMIVIKCMHYYRLDTNELTLDFLIALVSLQTMAMIRVFHYLFFIHLLDYQLDEIGTEAESLAEASDNEWISNERFRWIRMYYDLVYELSNCINEIFGWSNVVSILYLFLLLAVDIIWVYSHMYRVGASGMG